MRSPRASPSRPEGLKLLRLDACNTHWNYVRFEFAQGDRRCAAGYMKGAVVARSGLVPNVESYAALGQLPHVAPVPEPVHDWLAAERGVMSQVW
jgi:hypothetical protein